MYCKAVKLVISNLTDIKNGLIMSPSSEFKVTSCQVCSMYVYEMDVDIYMSPSVRKHIRKCSWQHSSHCNTAKLIHFRDVRL